jgi:hypothetical protein
MPKVPAAKAGASYRALHCYGEPRTTSTRSD